MFDIRRDDLTGEATRSLLALHLEGMNANSPPASVHAFDLSALRRPDIVVWTVWRGNTLAGVGALRTIDGATGEIKSMRTHPDFIRRGVAALLLEHMIDIARAQRLTRLRLETGSGPAFEPALALYQRHGFTEGRTFGNYVPTAFNRFLHLQLAP